MFVAAPVNHLMNRNLLQSNIKLNAAPSSQLTATNLDQHQKNLSTSARTDSEIPPTQPTVSQPISSPGIKAKSREESIELAGNFHYASHDSEPSQFSSDDVVAR